MRKLAIWILVIILLVGTVQALGVTPGRISLNFESNAEHSVSVKIVNSDKKALNLAITAEGELSQYMEITESRISFAANEEEKIITYKIRLPERFDKPGLKEGKLVVSQLPEELNGQLVIGALVSVVSQLRVQVPYPDKYIDADFNIQPDSKITKLHLSVKSLGQQKIENVKGIIYVLKDGVEVSRQEQLFGLMNTYDKRELLEILDLGEGEYDATGRVEYDGETIKLDKHFAVGELVKPLGITVDPKYKLGDIVELNVLLNNDYSIAVENINSKLILKDENDNVVLDVTGLNLNLDSKKQGIARIYLNTEDLTTGTYVGQLIISYRDHIVQRPVKIILGQDTVQVSLEDLTGLAVSNQQPARTDYGVWLPILFVLIIIMLILIVITNIRLVRMMKKGGPG